MRLGFTPWPLIGSQRAIYCIWNTASCTPPVVIAYDVAEAVILSLHWFYEKKGLQWREELFVAGLTARSRLAHNGPFTVFN